MKVTPVRRRRAFPRAHQYQRPRRRRRPDRVPTQHTSYNNNNNNNTTWSIIYRFFSIHIFFIFKSLCLCSGSGRFFCVRSIHDRRRIISKTALRRPNNELDLFIRRRCMFRADRIFTRVRRRIIIIRIIE